MEGLPVLGITPDVSEGFRDIGFLSDLASSEVHGEAPCV